MIGTLTYQSRASFAPTSEELDALVASARKRNNDAGVTGMLLYDGGRFLQTLEGPPDGLRQIWSSIQRDERHAEIEVLTERMAPARLFSEWDLLLYRKLEHAPKTIRERLAGRHALSQHISSAVRFALEADEQRLSELFRRLVTKRWDGEDIARHLIEPAARGLGDAWLADDCSEFDLTLGLGMLQKAAHITCESWPPSTMRSEHSILLASAPGEPHMLGPSLLADQFSDAGWAVNLLFPRSDEVLAEYIGEQQPDVVDLSLSDALTRHGAVSSLRASVEASRKAVPDQPLIVSVGGRLFAEATATAEHVGADHARKTTAGARAKLARLTETRRMRGPPCHGVIGQNRF